MSRRGLIGSSKISGRLAGRRSIPSIKGKELMVGTGRADMILTSLGSDEAVQGVYSQLFEGQEVSELRHRFSGEGESADEHRARKIKATVSVPADKVDPQSSSTPAPSSPRPLASSSDSPPPNPTEPSSPARSSGPQERLRLGLLRSLSRVTISPRSMRHTLWFPLLGRRSWIWGVIRSAQWPSSGFPPNPGGEIDGVVRLVGNALELGFIELLSECFTLSDQAGVGSDKLVALIKDQHKSPTLLRYADRITKNRFDSEGGFNLGGGIMDTKWVLAHTRHVLGTSSLNHAF